MKSRLFLFILVLALIPLIEAKPTISNIAVLPSSDLWLGDMTTFSFDCNEENHTIQKIKTTIESPIKATTNYKNQTGNTFFFDFLAPQTGQYNVSFYCESNNQTENSTYDFTLFNVYDLSASIDGVSPENIYVGDKITINTTVKRNNIELDGSFIYDLSFQVFLDSTNITNINYYYDPTDGWVINNINISTNPGTHVLKIKIGFGQKSIEIIRNIVVNPLVEFAITSIDKTEVMPGDNITIKMSAKDRGTNIDNSYSLSVSLGSLNVTKIDSTTGTNIDATLTIPSTLTQGEYNLAINFSYKGFSFSEIRKFVYPVRISGKILGGDGSTISTQIKLKKDNLDYKTNSTDSSGNYNILAPPGKYDVELTFYTDKTFPNAKLVLDDVDIKQLDNPIKFDYLKDINIDGIGYGGVYVFEVSLNYSKATLEMIYDGNKIPDENKIIVYRCSNWNTANKVCNDDLEELEYQLDASRNSVKVELNKLSTFIIAYSKQLNLNFGTDKNEYFLREPVKISGYVEDENGKAVSGVNLEIKVLKTSARYSAVTDVNGVFALEILSPESEGQFQIEIQASKFPYLSDTSTLNINVTKSRKMIIFMEDSIKLKQGENKTVWVSIINNGQADLFNLNIKLEGIPNEYYVLSTLSIPEVKAGQESKIMMEINIPASASVTNYLGKISVTSGSNYVEKQFLLSISENIPVADNNSTDTTFKLPQLKVPTAKIVLPSINQNTLIILSILIALLIIAYMLKNKNRKKKETERAEIKNFLLGINAEIKRNQK